MKDARILSAEDVSLLLDRIGVPKERVKIGGVRLQAEEDGPIVLILDVMVTTQEIAEAWAKK